MLTPEGKGFLTSHKDRNIVVLYGIEAHVCV